MQEVKTRARNWVFTLNNPDPVLFFDVEEKKVTFSECGWFDLKEKATFIICQLERGEGGTNHLQGYVECKNQLAFSTVRRWFQGRGHWEPRRGSQEDAINYCSKEDTRINGPWRWGKAKKQGERVDLANAVSQIKEGGNLTTMIFDNPGLLRYISHLQKLQSLIKPKRREMPKIAWLYGQTGTGKTKTAWEVFADPYIFTENSNGTQWFEGYRGEKELIYDEFGGHYPYIELLQLLDIYPMRVQVKGSSTTVNASSFIITSNSEPENFYMDQPNRDALQRRLEEWGCFGRFFRGGDGEVRVRFRFGQRCIYGRESSQEDENDLSVNDFCDVLKEYFNKE